MEDMESTSPDETPDGLLKDSAVARELKASQAAFERFAGIRARRRDAVQAAVGLGWRTSRIARAMDVAPATVTAILTAAAAKSDPKEQS